MINTKVCKLKNSVRIKGVVKKFLSVNPLISEYLIFEVNVEIV